MIVLSVSVNDDPFPAQKILSSIQECKNFLRILKNYNYTGILNAEWTQFTSKIADIHSDFIVFLSKLKSRLPVQELQKSHLKSRLPVQELQISWGLLTKI